MPRCPKLVIVNWEHLVTQHILLPTELECVSMLEVRPRENLVDGREWSLKRVGSNGFSCNQVVEIQQLAGDGKDSKLNP